MSWPNLRWADRFPEGHLRRGHAVQLHKVLVFAMAIWASYGLLNAVMGRPMSVLVDLAETAAIPLVWLLVRRSKGEWMRLTGLPHILMALAAIGLTVIALISGQGASYGQYYLLCLPLFAGMALDRRGTLLWAGLTVVLIGLIHGSALWWTIEPEFVASGAELAGGAGVLVVTVSGFALAMRASWDAKVLEADQAAAAKTAFLAEMSHELRTPLAGVLGLTRNLLGDSPTPSQQEKLLAIDRCGSTLLTLLEDLLQSSTTEVRTPSLQDHVYEPLRVAGDVVELLRHRAAAQGRRLILRGEAPPVLGDASRIQQVLLNLVANALDHGRGAVVLRVSAHEDRLRYEVEDEGPGLRDPKQFEAFEGDGTGLGLAISRRLAQAMGGQLTAEPGRGLLILDLPLRAVDLPQHSLDDLAPARVLVVEDNEVNRLISLEALQRLGYTPDHCSSGEEAVQRAHAYQLILMDLRLPGIDGREATRRIRASEHPVWIVALTANVLPDERAQCLSAGMNDFLGKPFRLNELHGVLERFTEALNGGGR